MILLDGLVRLVHMKKLTTDLSQAANNYKVIISFLGCFLNMIIATN